MPSIGKDLQKIRTHLGYTVQDIQQFTKIPVDTLQAIENNSIFNQSSDGTTYIRSFIRSYGRALRIDDDTLIKALDQQAIGNYSNLLVQKFPELSKSATEEPADPKVPESKPTHEPEIEDVQREPEPKNDLKETVKEEHFSESPGNISPDDEPVAVPTTETPANEPSPAKSTGEPSIKSVNWADLGQKAHNDKKKSSVWIIGIIILIIIAAIAGYLMYQNENLGFGNGTDNDGTTTEFQSTPGNISLDMNSNDELSAPVQNSEESGQQETDLDDVIYITIYAAYDVVDPVRVWSDLKPRLDPYWLEQGSALNFEFQDTIRIRGPYANMLIFKNGHLISDFQEFYSEEENYVELTRSYFNSDPKWATTVPFELPAGVAAPDRVSDRPTF